MGLGKTCVGARFQNKVGFEAKEDQVSLNITIVGAGGQEEFWGNGGVMKLGGLLWNAPFV